MCRTVPDVRRTCSYDAVCDFSNLMEAHRRARRGRLRKREAIEFELALGPNLVRLREELLAQTYELSACRHFVVSDPKRRDVHALSYRDRVVQHALCDEVLEPMLDPRLIYDNAASRRGKGTDFALGRPSGFLRDFWRAHGTDGYALKFGVRSYYASIDHAILARLFQRLFPYDPRLCRLLERTVDSHESAPGKGLPWGNQTSSWFAVYYLDGLDRPIKERQRLRHYSRYMDDGVVVRESREHLGECLAEMRRFLGEERGLELDERTQVVPLSQGVDYLGFHLFLTRTGKVAKRLRSSSKRRARARLKRCRHACWEGEMEACDVMRSLDGHRAHLARGDRYRLSQNLLSHLSLTHQAQEGLAWDMEYPRGI